MKKFFSIVAAALVALSMSAEVLYTLDTSLEENKGDGNSYFDFHTATVNGITWSAEGNMQMCPWRIGGKNDVVRHAKTTTAFAQPVASIKLTIGSVTSTLNSVKFMHSTSADFAGATEINVDIQANSSAVIAVAGGFPANSYFQFIFDEKCSASSNQYVQFSKVEFLSDVPVLTQPDTIIATVAEIIAMQNAQADEFNYYQTSGVVASILNTQYGNMFIADGNDSIKIWGTHNFANLNLAEGDSITIIGKMKFYGNDNELEFLDVDVLKSQGSATLDTLTVAEAMAKGNALADNAKSEKVVVVGYVVKAYAFGEKYEGVQSGYIADEVGAFGEFNLYNCNVAAPGFAEGDLVAVTGQIYKYVGNKTTIEITGGDVEVISAAAFESVEDGAKATKVIENGQMVIIRNGVRFNAAGARL